MERSTIFYGIIHYFDWAMASIAMQQITRGYLMGFHGLLNIGYLIIGYLLRISSNPAAIWDGLRKKPRNHGMFTINW